MLDDHLSSKRDSSKACELWEIEQFYADMAKEGLKFSPNAKKFFCSLLVGKSPKEISKNCGYTGKDPSGYVRQVIYKEIRPAIILLRDNKHKEKVYSNFGDIPEFLSPKYRKNIKSSTPVKTNENYQSSQEIEKQIQIQLLDLDTLSFGSINTTWLVKDGTGEKEYYRDNIICNYQNKELELPEEIKQKKDEIAQEQKKKQLKGEVSFWNGSRYSFDKFVITRTTREENPILNFWFRPSDYYTYLATNQCLDKNIVFREKYLQTDWQQPISLFANAFSVYLSVITEDGYLIITQRSLNVGSRPGELNISVNEALSRDKDHIGGKPDLYNLGTRGVAEELGIDISYSSLKYLSFGVDIKLGHWAMIGTVNISKGRESVKLRRSSGVEDKWENTGIRFVEFKLEKVIDFVFSFSNSTPWSPGAIACIYHTLVNKFGRDECDRELLKRM